MLSFILDAVLQLKLPVGQADTAQMKTCYEQGKAKVKSYHGHPQALLEALTLFQQSSESYAYIGISKVITAASYLSGDVYDHEGLARAVGWLDRAKTLPHDRLELLLTEIDIRICFQQYAKAHQLLDTLLQEDPSNFEARASRLELHAREEDVAKAEALFSQLLPEATLEQKKMLYQSLYSLYARAGRTYKAIEMLDFLIDVEPNNPWWHHNMSLLYLHLGGSMENIMRSKAHNDKALKLMPFPVAFMVRQELRGIIWRVRRQMFMRGVGSLVALFVIFRVLIGLASVPSTEPSQRILTPEREFYGVYLENFRTCQGAVKTGNLKNSSCKTSEEMLEQCIINLGRESHTCQSIATADALFSEARETVLKNSTLQSDE